MKTMHWPPHLRASFFALRARKRTITASMPMKVWAKPEPGIVTNGELKPVAIAFASIVLPVPGRAEEQQPALALAAGALERLARLPQRDDAPHLLLRLGLAADVVELDAPVGVARLVAADLRDAHQHQRAHEDQEVEDEEREEEEPDRDEGGDLLDRVADPVVDVVRACRACSRPRTPYLRTRTK